MSTSTIVEVTVKKLYIIPTTNSEEINSLITEWFSKKFLNSSHAYRDSCEVFGIKEYINHEIKDQI